MLTLRLTKRKNKTFISTDDVRVFLLDGTDITEHLGIRALDLKIEVGEPNTVTLNCPCYLENDDRLRLDSYPNIRKIILDVEYDNGGINRGRSEEEALVHAESVFFADGVPEKDVEALDIFLGTLTEEEFSTLASGEQSDMEKIKNRSPIGSEGHPVAKLIDDWFGE